MKHLKAYEGYIDDRILVLKKLKKFVDIMEKYKMKWFVISNVDPDENYQFEHIEKTDGGYTIEYIDYTQGEVKRGIRGNTYRSKDIKCELSELPNKVVDALILACSDGRFEIEYHLEMAAGDIEHFIEILKIHKKPIDFSEWMFIILSENEQGVGSYKFQDVLFSTHPEAYKAFINEYFDGLERSDDGKGYSVKLHPKIKTKYKDLLGDYYEQKEAEHEAIKFNM